MHACIQHCKNHRPAGSADDAGRPFGRHGRIQAAEAAGREVSQHFRACADVRFEGHDGPWLPGTHLVDGRPSWRFRHCAGEVRFLEPHSHQFVTGSQVSYISPPMYSQYMRNHIVDSTEDLHLIYRCFYLWKNCRWRCFIFHHATNLNLLLALLENTHSAPSLFQLSQRRNFFTHLDIDYVYIHNKSYISTKAKTTYILKWRKYYFTLGKKTKEILFYKHNK